MKCSNCGKGIESGNAFCENCGTKVEVEKVGEEEEKKEEKKKRKIDWSEITPRTALEILVYLIVPIGIFLYLVLGTDTQRYFAIFISLLIPGFIRVRAPKNDTSNRKDFGNNCKGVGLLLLKVLKRAGIIGLGLIVLGLVIRGIYNLYNAVEEKPLTIIAILLAGILLYLIKIYNKKN